MSVMDSGGGGRGGGGEGEGGRGRGGEVEVILLCFLQLIEAELAVRNEEETSPSELQ